MPESNRAPRRGGIARRLLGVVLRHPRITVAVVIGLVLVAVLAPLFGLIGGIFDVAASTVGPLLATPAGRLALLNIALAALALYGLGAVRARWRRMRGELRLRQHLEGVRLLLAGDPSGADAAFARVIASRAPVPDAWPHLADDARLKRARIALDRERPAEATRHLLDVDADALPAELARAARRLTIAAERRNGEVLPAALERSLHMALDAAPDDAALLDEYAGLLRELGRHAEAADVQSRLVDATAPGRRPAARARELDDRLAAAEASFTDPQRGDPTSWLASIERQLDAAARLAPEDARPALVRARAREAAGDLRSALVAFAAAGTVRGLDEVARLLDAHPGLVTPRELLELCPVEGAVLLAAREHARRGDLTAAHRAVAAVADRLEPTPRVATVLAAVLELCGRDTDAAELRSRAARHLARLDLDLRPDAPI